ncbi:hypothetical protein T492DRAFT_1061556, partial [Pavlovales sp. CCMP2436]
KVVMGPRSRPRGVVTGEDVLHAARSLGIEVDSYSLQMRLLPYALLLLRCPLPRPWAERYVRSRRVEAALDAPVKSGSPGKSGGSPVQYLASPGDASDTSDSEWHSGDESDAPTEEGSAESEEENGGSAGSAAGWQAQQQQRRARTPASLRARGPGEFTAHYRRPRRQFRNADTQEVRWTHPLHAAFAAAVRDEQKKAASGPRSMSAHPVHEWVLLADGSPTANGEAPATFYFNCRTRERSDTFPKLAEHHLESALAVLGVSRLQAEAIRAETEAASDGADVPPPPARPPPPPWGVSSYGAHLSHTYAPRASPLRSRAASMAASPPAAATARATAAAEEADATALAWLENPLSRAELRATVSAAAAVTPVQIGWLLRCALLLGLSLPGDEHLMWLAEALWASRCTN